MIKSEFLFALYSLKKNLQSSAELRTSFIMNVLGMIINNSVFILLWTFFVKTVGVINGWQAIDIVALQGFVAWSFGITFSFFSGLRNIPDYVSSGAFDRFMLSPKNLLLRVATSSLGVSSIGDIIFAIVCFITYSIIIHATFAQVFCLILLMITTAITFFSIILIISSISFYFSDPNSVAMGLLELFLTPSMFHGGAFQGVLRLFFTFIVPSLVIGSLPVEIIRHMDYSYLFVIIGLALGWFTIAIKIFYLSVKNYESSNFFTFGG